MNRFKYFIRIIKNAIDTIHYFVGIICLFLSEVQTLFYTNIQQKRPAYVVGT